MSGDLILICITTVLCVFLVCVSSISITRIKNPERKDKSNA